MLLMSAGPGHKPCGCPEGPGMKNDMDFLGIPFFLYSAEICDKWGQELIFSMYIAINVNVHTFIYSKK